MPCSAPCNRLPCSRRCSLILDCGHQCPSLCGEDCPTGFCQICCSDGRKHHLEFKSYSEINLDETPIVVLSCGHSFTAETLDGHMQMSEVYEHLPATGEYTGLHENIESLAPAPPRCPDCERTVRQFATQRYNRAINRAVIDQMSKRFLVSGGERIRNLDEDIDTNEP